MRMASCPVPNPRLVASLAAAAISIGMLAVLVWPRTAAAYGLLSRLDHVVVIAHASADRREARWKEWRAGDAPALEHSGRYGTVFPAADALPNHTLTPGALNPAVTQADLRETICRPGGYTRSIRPPERVTERLKREQIRQYAYPEQMGRDAGRLSNYEEDHLVSLELGGSPDSPRNLWPEPHHVIGGWGSYVKDQLENRLHRMVCRDQISLAAAQHLIATDWIAAYQRYVSPTPVQKRSHRYGG